MGPAQVNLLQTGSPGCLRRSGPAARAQPLGGRGWGPVSDEECEGGAWQGSRAEGPARVGAWRSAPGGRPEIWACRVSSRRCGRVPQDAQEGGCFLLRPWRLVGAWYVTVRRPLSRPALGDPRGCKPARLLCPWASGGKNPGVGCHVPSSRNLPSPGIEPGSPTSQAES